MKTKSSFTNILICICIYGMTMHFQSCKKDSTDNSTNINAEKKYVLMIENGSQTVKPDEKVSYSAILIDKNGISTPATGVSWSTTNQEVATINSNGLITIKSTGMNTVKASVTIEGNTYTALAPINIAAPSIFTVSPSAVLHQKGGTLQLETIYLSVTGVSSPNCTFTSSNNSIATVSSTGLVSFISAGECNITVTATNLEGKPVNNIPILVIGEPEITLPVTSVTVNPPSKDLFKNETQQLTAKAYKSNGQEVTGKTFVWSSQNPHIASVSNTGLITPLQSGTTYIYAKTDGIIGQAEITVNSDTLVVITPYFYTIPSGSSKQFTAKAYHLTRNSSTLYTGVTFDWYIPTYGFAAFDIATVNNTGLVTLKSNALPGMSSLVIATDHNNVNIGAAAIISVAIADDCNCGDGNSTVNRISVSNSQPINMSLISGTPVQLNATAYTSTNTVVPNANLVYCSDNIQVLNISSDGQMIATGVGTATIKICSGSYASTTVTVTVGM